MKALKSAEFPTKSDPFLADKLSDGLIRMNRSSILSTRVATLSISRSQTANAKDALMMVRNNNTLTQLLKLFVQAAGITTLLKTDSNSCVRTKSLEMDSKMGLLQLLS